MRRSRLFLGISGMVALATATGCQSLWNSIPGTGSSAATPPPKPASSGLFAQNELPSQPITKAQRADVQMTVGRSCEKNDELDKAIKIYEDVVRKDPKRTDALHRLAVAHDKLGHFKESGECYRKALAREPKNAEILVDQGYSFYLQRRWAECEKSLRGAIAVAPDMKRAHNNLGLVLARTERFDAALWEFKYAGCNEAEGRANLMHALMVDERWPEAQQQCQLALASHKATPQLQQRLEQMQRMIAGRCNRVPATVAERADALQVAAQPSAPPHVPAVPTDIAAPTPADPPAASVPKVTAPMVSQVAAFAPTVSPPVRIPAVAEEPNTTAAPGEFEPPISEALLSGGQPMTLAPSDSAGPTQLKEGPADSAASAPGPDRASQPQTSGETSSIRFIE